MLLNMLNDLAEATKASDEKKKTQVEFSEPIFLKQHEREVWRSGFKDMSCWCQQCHKPFCKEFYDPILELGEGVLDRLKS